MNDKNEFMEEENGNEMEQRIQRIVQEELQKASTNEEGSNKKGKAAQFDDEKKLHKSASEIELEPEATNSSTPPQLLALAAISPENNRSSLESTGTTNLDELYQKEEAQNKNEEEQIGGKRNQKGET